MDDIADAAGVSKPVSSALSSKLDLYPALLDQSRDWLVEIVEEALAQLRTTRIGWSPLSQRSKEFVSLGQR